MLGAFSSKEGINVDDVLEEAPLYLSFRFRAFFDLVENAFLTLFIKCFERL